MTCKEKIEKSFSRAADSYDQHALLQQKVMKKLIACITAQQRHFVNIVDMACGTGEAIPEILQQFSPGHLYAMDISSKLLGRAAEKYQDSRVHFTLADFDKSLPCLAPIDLLFCNMGLQWAMDLPHTFSIFKSVLSENGMLAFSLPLFGTCAEILESHRNKFHTDAVVQEALRKTKFSCVHREEQTLTYSFFSPIQALRSFSCVGAQASNRERIKKLGLSTPRQMAAIFADPENIALSYRIGYFIVVAS